MGSLADSIAGGVGAVGALLVTYPLKTIYTLQALAGTPDGAKALGILDVMRKYRLGGLYVGIGPNIVESFASNWVFFGAFAEFKRRVLALHAKKDAAGGHSSHSLGVLESLLVSTLAGAVNQVREGMAARHAISRLGAERAEPFMHPGTTLEVGVTESPTCDALGLRLII